MTDKPLLGRITLVTGATRGIGYYAALALADAGSQVVAVGRTQGALEELDDTITSKGGQCTLVPMDLKNFEGIDQLGSIINERWGRLDGLFGNAGILGHLMPSNQIEPKTFEDVFAINMTANYRLIRSLDPLLRMSEAGRAVFMTSSVALGGRAFWGAYAASKSALETFVYSYAEEVNVTQIRVNLLNPGGTATSMRAKAIPGENPDTLPQPEALAPLIVDMLSPGYQENGGRVNFRDTPYFTQR